MAAFRKGHVKAVKWMVHRVTQFPSDQEMNRYVSTISLNEKVSSTNLFMCPKLSNRVFVGTAGQMRRVHSRNQSRQGHASGKGKHEC